MSRWNYLNGPYKDLRIRLLFSLFAAHLIVSHGVGFFSVLVEPGYFISLLASAIIGYILFEIIHLITILLDRHFSWDTSLYKRLLFQILVGVLLTVLIAYLLADRLFVVMDEDIAESNYMQYDFYFICSYIVLINVYYYVGYKLRVKSLMNVELNQYKNYHRAYTFKNAPVNLKDMDLEALDIKATAIACVYIMNGNLFMLDMKCNKTLVAETMEEAIKKLSSVDYLRVNRFCVVHRLLILSVKEATSRRATLTLRLPFNFVVPDKFKNVSQFYRSKFLKAFNE